MAVSDRERIETLELRLAVTRMENKRLREDLKHEKQALAHARWDANRLGRKVYKLEHAPETGKENATV